MSYFHRCNATKYIFLFSLSITKVFAAIVVNSESALIVYLHFGVSFPSKCNSWTGLHQFESPEKA